MIILLELIPDSSGHKLHTQSFLSDNLIPELEGWDFFVLQQISDDKEDPLHLSNLMFDIRKFGIQRVESVFDLIIRRNKLVPNVQDLLIRDLTSLHEAEGILKGIGSSFLLLWGSRLDNFAVVRPEHSFDRCVNFLFGKIFGNTSLLLLLDILKDFCQRFGQRKCIPTSILVGSLFESNGHRIKVLRLCEIKFSNSLQEFDNFSLIRELSRHVFSQILQELNEICGLINEIKALQWIIIVRIPHGWLR